jgi:hypothetical protein
MLHALRLPSAAGSSLSSATVDLVDAVRDSGGWRTWSALMEREQGYTMALTREAAEAEARKKDQRDGASKED